MECRRRIIILSLVICLLFSLSGVCASELNDTTVTAADMEIKDNDLSNSNQENSLCEDYGGDFNALQNLIDNANDNDVISLNKSYTFTTGLDDNFTKGIDINKTLTIDGNGYTIDAVGKARIFNICGSGVKLTNITFINAIGVNSTKDQGGAIHWEGDNGSLFNCNFINNSDNYDGSAIYLRGDNYTVFNCSFLNSPSVAATVCMGGYNGSVINCSFINCSSNNTYGGAIYCMNRGYISNCSFINCFNTKGSGGAILSGSWCLINGCSFINCSARGGGGAIQIRYGNATVYNCSFINCSSGEGGAIHIRRNNTSVYNCSFMNCHVNTTDQTAEGGVIFVSGDNCRVYNCNFTNNYIKSNRNSYGGAISWRANNSTVYGCSFVNNSANNGGALNMWGNNTSVSGCRFINNSAGRGSAIYFTNNCRISNSTFMYNKINAILTGVDYNNYGYLNFTFQKNIGDKYINAIYTTYKTIDFDNITYLYNGSMVNSNTVPIVQSSDTFNNLNIAVEVYLNDILVDNQTIITDDDGVAIYPYYKLSKGNYTYKAYPASERYICENTGSFTEASMKTFSDLQKVIDVSADGDIINLDNNITFTEGADDNLTRGIVVNKNLTIDGKGYTIDAVRKARIFNIIAEGVKLINITFINANNNDDYGGAVYWTSAYGFVSDCSFISCSAKKGGAVYWMGSKGSIFNCSFVSCSATDGGAIYWSSSKAKVNNCSFMNCSATYGGAVTWGSSHGSVSGCSFVNCSARDGGAIYCLAINSSFYNCNFMGCFAKQKSLQGQASGGAIYLKNYDCSVYNCTFRDCFIGNTYGGAICWEGDNGVLYNCDFVNCSSNVYGGAIYWSGDKANVYNCSFMNCSAGEEAGAILFCGSNPSISNSSFVNNFVIGEGSAIRINHDGRISNCTFMYNKLSATLNSIDYNNKGVMNFIFNRVGANNYFDAIHALVPGAPDFYNITYYYNGSILNTNTVHTRYSINNNYDGLILIVEIYDGNTLVDNVSLISDDTGNVEYDYTYLSDGNYTYKAYHPNGGYYIYTESTGNFICKHIKPNVTVTVSNVTYGDYPVVNLTSDVEGNYSLVVAGKYYGIYELNKNNNLSILIPVTELLNGGNDYIASVEFEGYSIYAPASANTTFNINQALSNFNATSTESEYYYGQDIIFIVELPSDATGNVTFYCLNRTVGEIDNISQQKSLNISIWNADTYAIQAKYSGDNNYENSTQEFTFKVNAINNMIKVIADSVEYPNEVNIRVNATVDGVYVIDINGTKYNVTANGQGINLKLAAGNYFANITNKSDVNHIFIPINTTFAVSKAINHVEVIVADKILPGATNVTVKATVDGVYTVVINGTYSVDVNVSGGTGSGSVDLPAGKLYFATTSFVHQNYTSEIINSTFDVDKGINNINVVVDNVVYPNEVNIRVNATVDGVYVIDINGTKYNVTANGEGINVKLAAGSYFADIVNVTDEDYIFITNNATFVIDKKPTSPDEINITDLGNTTSGNATLIIKVPNNLTGNITITIGDKNYTTPIINGTANVDLNELMPNNYTATVTYHGDENNTLISKNITIKIDKANLDLQINITQGNLTEPTILDFTVPVDFDGKITVEINNNTQEVILINGKGSISVNLGYGNFTAHITAVNSIKYYDLTITENIEVVDLRIPLNPETVIIIPTNISNNSTISLNLPEDANGEVYMMVDSIIYLNSTVNNGTINPIALTNISPGNHIIFIYYTGDNKYQPMNKTFNITIPVITLKGVDLTVLYSGELLYKVQVLSDGKNITDGTSITIIFNNNKFTVQTKGGYATLLLQSELKPDTYKITANYTNITTTNNIVIKNIINAKKLKKLKKSKKVNKVKASLIKVDGKYLKGKKLTLKIKGKKVATAKTNKKGTATFKVKKKKLKKFKKGKYTASVIYGQDIYNKKIKIK